MYANGKMIKDIVAYLNEKGVRSSQNKPMTKTSVTALLKNVKYRGQYKYRDIVIDDGVPRIVSDELFQLAQERLIKNQQSRSRFKAKVEYFLSAKLICGDCGSAMVGESGTSGAMRTVYEHFSRYKFNEPVPLKGKGRVKAIHYIQSFDPADNVSPELAHKIAKAFARKTFGDDCQIVIATHYDRTSI